ncbi:probable 4-coumarate--CoA ligase 2 [Uranotaenia lowii]|uniref:probable 4-coumarate--CoA ligase 2 n=1 Tax=Uranotaenia lowii TaxID=190385 RepID=UPI002479E0F2|nr:probable 4-coumarate--CoA ligase 2 [Uranotaenia lowii]
MDFSLTNGSGFRLVFTMASFDRDRRVWSGPRQPCVFNPECNFGQIVMNLLERSPEKVVQIDGDTGRTMTRAQMRLHIVRVAQNIQSLGYGVGDIASVVAVNSEYLAPLVLGLQVIGVGFNALSPTFDENEMIHMMRQTQSKLVFCDADNYHTVKAAAEKAIEGSFRIFIMERAPEESLDVMQLFRPTGKELGFYPRYLGDSYKLTASITCSSGTTGLPKGVCYSHALTISGFCKVANFDDGISLNFSTLYWGTGVYVLNMSIMNNCTRLITRRQFSADLFFELIEKFPIKFLYTPASFAASIAADPRAAKTNLSSIKVWALGASNVSECIRDEVDILLKPQGGRSYNFYGTSESGFIAADFIKRKPKAVGRVGINMQVRTLDESDRPLEVEEQGEVVVKSVGIPFLGYYKNEEASRVALDSDGWFRTGDIGYFDEEGYLYLVDRKKEILKYAGNQVSPREVEAVIECIEGISQVCVVGVPNEDKTSDLVTAVVKLDGTAKLTAEDVISVVAKRLSDPKHIRGGVYRIFEFPMTSNGKIVRREVRRMLLDGEINKRL